MGKHAFEEHCRQHTVTVQHYHAGNGIFKANKWKDECRTARQGLTFAGVNAHHANASAERRVQSLQDLARSVLIHSNRRWKMPCTVNLWPYALRMACDAINESKILNDHEKRSPMQIFSHTQTLTHIQSTGCHMDTQCMYWRMRCKPRQR